MYNVTLSVVVAVLVELVKAKGVHTHDNEGLILWPFAAFVRY